MDVTKQHNLYPNIKFRRQMTEARWQDDKQIWEMKFKCIDTGDIETQVADIVIFSTAPLSIPSVPNFPGIEKFKGKIMHSALWDKEYDFHNKKVAVIGTGASAVQIVPRLAPIADQLTVFQRTPAYILPKWDVAYSSAAKFAFKNIPGVRWFHRLQLYLLNEVRFFGFMPNSFANRIAVNWNRSWLESQVKDPEVRAKLTPNYAFGCKRVTPSNTYLATFNRSNVGLVADGIDSFDEDGIWVRAGENGEKKKFEVDTVVCATGFNVQKPDWIYQVYGRNGSQGAQNLEGYLGTTMPEYPNFYMLLGPNTGLGHNSIVYMIECQVNYIVKLLRAQFSSGVRTLEVKDSAMQKFNKDLQPHLDASVWARCDSWYRDENNRVTAVWPFRTPRYWLATLVPKFEDYQPEIPFRHRLSAFRGPLLLSIITFFFAIFVALMFRMSTSLFDGVDGSAGVFLRQVAAVVSHRSLN
ncbi:hypothetical protein HK102_012847 [Quaeritorhiza haematococci]|nr:hypothetical protein HK102_012847 [Quaeritorhiza haematococci]